MSSSKHSSASEKPNVIWADFPFKFLKYFSVESHESQHWHSQAHSDLESIEGFVSPISGVF